MVKEGHVGNTEGGDGWSRACKDEICIFWGLGDFHRQRMVITPWTLLSQTCVLKATGGSMLLPDNRCLGHLPALLLLGRKGGMFWATSLQTSRKLRHKHPRPQVSTPVCQGLVTSLTEG